MKKKKSFSTGRHLILFVVVVLLVANFSWAYGNPMQSSSFKEKSPDTAKVLSSAGASLSLLLTFVSMFSSSGALFILWWGALVIGPSPGYFYGGLAERGIIGMGIRGGGLAIIITGIMNSPLVDVEEGQGGLLIIGGLAIAIGSTIYDLVKVRGAVEKHNLKVREKMLKISPTYIPQAKAFGITIQVRF